MNFGERLTELRISNGYSKRNEFADKLGIPSTTLRNYETGVRAVSYTHLPRPGPWQISRIRRLAQGSVLLLHDRQFPQS